MKALHKVVMGGTLGGLAVATAAASGAFACTASAAVEVKTPSGLSTVVPGQPVEVTVRTFNPGLPIQLTWENSTTMARVTEQVGPTFTLHMRIPSNAKAGEGYNLMARQYEPSEDKVWSSFAKVTIAGTIQQPKAPPPPPPAPPESRPQITNAPLQNSPAPAANGSTASQPAAKAPAAAAAGQPQLQGPALAAADVAAQPGVAAPQGAGTLESPVVVGEAVPQAALPVATEDLWSGLNADTTPSLLDSGAPAAPRSGFPVGGSLLLGTGVLAMAGAALEAVRRQRQAVRVYRR